MCFVFLLLVCTINYKVVFWEKCVFIQRLQWLFIRSCHKHLLSMMYVIYYRVAAYLGERGFDGRAKEGAEGQKGGYVLTLLLFF